MFDLFALLAASHSSPAVLAARSAWEADQASGFTVRAGEGLPATVEAYSAALRSADDAAFRAAGPSTLAAFLASAECGPRYDRVGEALSRKLEALVAEGGLPPHGKFVEVCEGWFKAGVFAVSSHGLVARVVEDGRIDNVRVPHRLRREELWILASELRAAARVAAARAQAAA